MVERELGERLPISIGTALAFEGIDGIDVKWPEEIWISVRTLLRNVLAAFTIENRSVVACHQALLDDILLLEEIVEAFSDGKTKLTFYLCSYKSVPKLFQYAKIRTSKTKKQQENAELENRIIHALCTEYKFIRFFDTRIKARGAKGYIFTHQPVDLLSMGDFNNVKLLESYTGKLKPYHLWYTKLSGGADLTGMPFNAMTLQIFGDGNNLFYTMPSKVKKEIISLANQFNWTSMTTKDKINANLKHLRDHLLARQLKNMLNVKVY